MEKPIQAVLLAFFSRASTRSSIFLNDQLSKAGGYTKGRRSNRWSSGL